MEHVERINKILKESFGLSETNEPRFRVVFSTGLIEKRSGTFREFYGPIFLCEVEGTREVPKYQYARDRYIFEICLPYKRVYEEIKQGDNYEPLFTFEDEKGEFALPSLELSMQIAQTYIKNITEYKRKTEKQYLDDEMKLVEKDYKAIYEYLKDEHSDMQAQFRYGEAVIIHRGDK